MILEKKIEHVYKPCYSCKRIGHFVHECPFLHFNCNKDHIIKKYIFSQPNDRDPSYRRNNSFSNKSIHANSLISKKKIQILKDIYEKNKIDRIFIEFQLKEPNINLTFDEDDELNERGDSGVSSEMNNPEAEETKDSSLAIKQNQLMPNFNKSRSKKLESDDNINIKRNSFSKNTQNQEFEINLISKLRERKKILLNNDVPYSYSEDISCNLFDYEFDRKKNYKVYYPNYNFDESLRNYIRFLRFREKKFKKSRMSFKKGMKFQW